jgi:vesicle coat complex subunit
MIFLILAAASCFVNLVIKESDNNVKLIVLDRLDALRSKHGAVLDGLIMDVLQVLSRFVFSFFPSSILHKVSNVIIAVRTWKFGARPSILF